MINLLKYFYFFSKLTTNFVLVAVIIFIGYIFLKSYKSGENRNINDIFNDKLEIISESINDNTKFINLLNKQITENQKDYNKIYKTLDENENKKQSKYLLLQIDKLLKENKILQNEIKLLFTQVNDLKNDKEHYNNINYNENNISIFNNLITLIKVKYKSGLDINEELVLLEKLNQNEFNNTYIEKLFILSETKFIGSDALKNEYNVLMKKYLNFYFIKKNNNLLIRNLSSFVTIEPNNKLNFQNKTVENFSIIKNKINDDDFISALNSLNLIKDSESYFKNWIDKTKHYLEFINTLEKISLDYD